MPIDFWHENLLPFLKSQNLSDADIGILYQSKLNTQLESLSFDCILAKLLIDADVVDDYGSLWVKYPRICHAVLFCSHMLLDANKSPLLNVIDDKVWCQMQFLEHDDAPMEKRECAMNNPSNFLSSHSFWLMKKPYPEVRELNALAEKWGNFCRTANMKLPSSDFRFELANMELYEACFYICMDHATLNGDAILLASQPNTHRPIKWEIVENGHQIFPPDFYNSSMKTAWKTFALCLQSNETTIIEPWLGRIPNGSIITTTRTKRQEYTGWWPSWSVELAHYNEHVVAKMKT